MTGISTPSSVLSACTRPRRLPMVAAVPSSVCAAKRPSTRMRSGFSKAICRIRYGLQAAISSGLGLRLPGGRHLITLVMNTSVSRLMPTAASMASSNWPDRPTKGWPCRSSCAPGASPTTSQRVGVAP
ncbi:hypothetical protein G6F59_018487 [Rhizopus arrhizus]|nr:hypothetical protein G6F59_018487 [Rhizopus arrhizus]